MAVFITNYVQGPWAQVGPKTKWALRPSGPRPKWSQARVGKLGNSFRKDLITRIKMVVSIICMRPGPKWALGPSGPRARTTKQFVPRT